MEGFYWFLENVVDYFCDTKHDRGDAEGESSFPYYSFLFEAIITVRNEVAKVMFIQACVCPQGRGCLPQCMLGYPPLEQTSPWGADTPSGSRHPREQTPLEQTAPPEQTRPPSQLDPPPRSRHPPPRDGHCCGRYASYWNAFLFY